jgi:hypothetical protein
VPQALEMVREFHPRLGDLTADTPAVATFSLAGAQLVTARHDHQAVTDYLASLTAPPRS